MRYLLRHTVNIVADFTLIPYSEDVQSFWDSVVNSSKNGNFLHLRDYISYHAQRFDEQSVLVKKNGNVVAVFPCNRIGGQIISHSGLTYGGLIYTTELRAVDVLDIFKIIMDYYRGMGCTSLLYKVIPHIFHRYPADEDLYALFRMGAKLVRRDISSAVALNGKLKLSESRRGALRKAVKQGISVQEGVFFLAFHSLLLDVLLKFGSHPVHSPEELLLLNNRFPNRIRLFGAYDKDRLLAGALVYDFGSVVHTQYLASSDEGKGLGALDYVLSHLLDDVFSDRQYFSFGISTEHDGQFLNEGLIFQKEGFGGRGVVHDFYKLEL